MLSFSDMWLWVRYPRLWSVRKGVVTLCVRQTENEGAIAGGFMVAPGYICTVAHGVIGAHTIQVYAHDGRQVQLTSAAIKRDVYQGADVALLHVPELADLPVLPLGDMRPMDGRPRRLVALLAGDAPKSGWQLVTAFARQGFNSVQDYEFRPDIYTLIRHKGDFGTSGHVVQPGDSGSPVLNIDGTVAGMVFASLDRGVLFSGKIDVDNPPERRYWHWLLAGTLVVPGRILKGVVQHLAR